MKQFIWGNLLLISVSNTGICLHIVQEVRVSINRLLFLLCVEYLVRHGPYRKHRIKCFLYFCVCIRCSGNVFTQPLPSNDLDTRTPR
jgi:hypothetical protein